MNRIEEIRKRWVGRTDADDTDGMGDWAQEDIEHLLAEVKRLREDAKKADAFFAKCADASDSALTRCLAEIKVLRDALEFYADEKSYICFQDEDTGSLDTEVVVQDDGRTARTALVELRRGK